MSNKQHNFTPKETRQRRTNKFQSQYKEIIKIRGEINEVETKKIEKINEIKSQFFEKINKIDKHLASLIKKKRAQINKFRNKKSYNWHHRNRKDHKRLLQATLRP